MSKATVSGYGQRSIFMGELLQHQPFDVVSNPSGPCDCDYEERDPDSYHRAGCSSLYITVRLSNGEEKLLLRKEITILP